MATGKRIGFVVVGLGHISEIAIRCGRKITWDPVKEEIIGDATATRMLTRAMRESWQL